MVALHKTIKATLHKVHRRQARMVEVMYVVRLREGKTVAEKCL